MNRGKNHVVSRASRVMITSTRTCACVRLGELPSPCDTRDGEEVFRQMIMPMIGGLAPHRESINPVAVTPVFSLRFSSNAPEFSDTYRQDCKKEIDENTG